MFSRGRQTSQRVALFSATERLHLSVDGDAAEAGVERPVEAGAVKLRARVDAGTDRGADLDAVGPRGARFALVFRCGAARRAAPARQREHGCSNGETANHGALAGPD